MNDEDKREALEAVVAHYGLPVLLAVVEEIVGKIGAGVMSTPLDTDPQKASIALYAARMKYEGALALKNNLLVRIKEIKGSKK